LPRTSHTIKTGTSVTDKNDAKNIANVFVKASGLKSLPSWASKVKTGRNETVMTSSEKKSGFPISFAAATTTRRRSASGDCSSRLWAFSTITTAASTITPMAMAMPPRDMMLEVRPRYNIGMKAMIMAAGSITMATSELRK